MENLEIRYSERIRQMPVSSTVPITFNDDISELAIRMPTTPPAENAPFHGCHNGRMERAVEMLRKNTTEPNTLIPAASIAARAHPFPRQQPQQNRQTKRAEAQQLEAEIGGIRSGQTCEVMRVRRACHRIPGGILRDDKRSGTGSKKSPVNRNTNPPASLSLWKRVGPRIFIPQRSGKMQPERLLLCQKRFDSTRTASGCCAAGSAGRMR